MLTRAVRGGRRAGEHQCARAEFRQTDGAGIDVAADGIGAATRRNVVGRRAGRRAGEGERACTAESVAISGEGDGVHAGDCAVHRDRSRRAHEGGVAGRRQRVPKHAIHAVGRCGRPIGRRGIIPQRIGVNKIVRSGLGERQRRQAQRRDRKDRQNPRQESRTHTVAPQWKKGKSDFSDGL